MDARTHAKDVKTKINNTLRVSRAFLVKFENKNEKDEKAAMAQRIKILVVGNMPLMYVFRLGGKTTRLHKISRD